MSEIKKVLITGAAGFIGAALVERFLKDQIQVIGIDNFNNYYNPLLKQKRVENIKQKDKMSESIIQMKEVNKWFGDFQVLKDINLEVKEKQKIVANQGRAK